MTKNHGLFLQKIPRRVVHDGMHGGDITIVYHPDEVVQASYTRSTVDGRISVNCWTEIVDNQPTWKIGDKMMFQLYLGNAGPYLFVSHIHDVALD